ncbi:MAG: RsmB/NOP family class I SAM-dependent RNA methyltransferase [Myxococcales bacterium]|nr:RsmB/NOP family class I SAM-dependent RNA methyltransferase [Myxococcales bacterium]
MSAASHPLDWLRRYADLVDDVDVFLEASVRPLPRVVWINPLRGPVEVTEAALRRDFLEARPVPWRPHAWRLPTDVSFAGSRLHLGGFVYGQEEAALWAGDLVGAQPGERVADLCAAPGGKAAQIAVAMQDRGTLVANDRKLGRLAALRRTLDRLGVTNAAVSCHDAAVLPAPEGWFDRVLADVPCTCEGTTRKPRSRYQATDERYRASIVQVQKAALRRAVKLTRPGGTIVYATCTYAPEENEGVLDAVDPSLVTVEPLDVPPGLRVTPGITAWDGRHYRPDAANAARLWPHHNDTGGFFVARLRRL